MTLFLSLAGQALADARGDAINELKAEYISLMGQDDAQNAENRATDDVDALIDSMENDQYNVQVALDAAHGQVDSLPRSSTRRDDANDAIERADHRVGDFTDMDAARHIEVIHVTAGALPYVTPDSAFKSAQEAASGAVTEVRRIILNPERPGTVPAGDLLTDFIPTIIRQLFRFAWLAVFVSLTVSGVYFVIAQEDEERLTKAKAMIYWSLIGFAFVTLAFAVVKAVTDIDFFGFV